MTATKGRYCYANDANPMRQIPRQKKSYYPI